MVVMHTINKESATGEINAVQLPIHLNQPGVHKYLQPTTISGFGVCLIFQINKHKQTVHEQLCSRTSDVIGRILVNEQRTVHERS